MTDRNIENEQYEAPIIIHQNQLGLGMGIQLLPALLDLKNRIKNRIIICTYKNQAEIFEPFFGRENLYFFKEKKLKEGEFVTDPIFDNRYELVFNYGVSDTIHQPYACHAVDYYFRLFHPYYADIAIPMEKKNYPKLPETDISKFDIPENAIAIGITSTKPSCQITPNIYEFIENYLIKNNYTPVYLGNLESKNLIMPDKTIHNLNVTNQFYPHKGINLIGKTSITEMTTIISKSKCYIGPEGGLMHFCGMTDTPMIIPFTSMSPKTRMPYRNNELGYNVYPIIPDIDCKFCITRTVHAKANLNVMQECYFNDFKCLNIPIGKFKEQIDKVLYA